MFLFLYIKWHWLKQLLSVILIKSKKIISFPSSIMHFFREKQQEMNILGNAL